MVSLNSIPTLQHIDHSFPTWYSLQTSKQHFVPLFKELIKDITIIPTPKEHNLYPGTIRHWAMDHLPLNPALHSLFQSFCGSPMQSGSLYFVCNNIMGDYVKSLSEVKVNDIHCSPLHWANHLTTEHDQVGWAQFILANSMLALPSYFFAALLSIHRKFYLYLKWLFFLNTLNRCTSLFLLQSYGCSTWKKLRHRSKQRAVLIRIISDVSLIDENKHSFMCI